MTGLDPSLDEAHAHVFAQRDLPELVFQPAIESCAWLSFEGLCCGDGWAFLRELARQHGDDSVHIEGTDLREHRLVVAPMGWDSKQYQLICDDDLFVSTIVHWWGSSGRWGVHGSRDLEIVVAGRAGLHSWPHVVDCRVLTIDAAMRLCRGSDEVRRELLTTYDAMSWDPALEDHEALPQLLACCGDVAADRVDRVVAIRRLVDLLNRVPKSVRRIAATGRLHRAWTRTAYLLIEATDRSSWGELLLAQNDRNHMRHAEEERPLVLQACAEIVAAADSGRD